MVVIGVAGEGFEIVTKVARHRSKKVQDWYSKHEFKIDITSSAFWIFVVLGLMIELWANTQGRILADKENAQLLQAAEQAKADAARAESSAQKAKLEREKLEKQTEELRNKVTQAELQSALAQSNAAALQLVVQWRTISAEQETDLINALRPIANALPEGKKSVLVRAEGENPETKRFALRIVNVLQRCGFQVNIYAGTNLGVRPGEGVLFVVKDGANPPPHANPIFHEFQKLQLKSLNATNDPGVREIGPDSLLIWVLPKPE
jgi:hypothetical protein